MRARIASLLVVALVAGAAAQAQERTTRKAKLGRDGRVTITNPFGDIVVTGGSGEEVTIEAVARPGRGRREPPGDAVTVDERPGRVDVRASVDLRTGRSSADLVITVPAAAIVDAKSVSGNVHVSNVQGAVRMETATGTIEASATPKLELAKSLSGDVVVTDVSAATDVSIASVSGEVRAKALKGRGIDVSTVSGDITLADVTCDRLGIKSVSGDVQYTGELTKNGEYTVNLHSGTARFIIGGGIGFELAANTFSGAIRSDLPLSAGRRPAPAPRRGAGSQSLSGTFGDGSAAITIRTFSGDVVIAKR